MTKGVSAKFVSYSDTIPRLLKLLKFDVELQDHDKIVIKPFMRDSTSPYTSPALVEQVLRFCLEYKQPQAQLFIAEGSDGEDTEDLFDSTGYKKLAERYNVGLVDLNHAETEETRHSSLSKFEFVAYPKLLKDAFVISLAPLALDNELGMIGAVSNMIGAFPAKRYRTLFSRKKEKIRKWPMAYSVHDISICKLPDFAIIDASDKGIILAGKPLEMDKEAAKLLGKDSKSLPYLRLIEETQAQAAIRAADGNLIKAADEVKE
jgi:uncharacterized protein (DUF362 family)